MRKIFIFRYFLTIVAPLFGILPLSAQSNSSPDSLWTLQECIQQAIDSNLRVKRNEVDVRSSRAQWQQTRLSMIPSLSGRVSHSYQFGRSIDPTTNDFVTNTIRTNGISLDANLLLFDGLRKQNSIKRDRLQYRANRTQKETTKDEITLSVVNQFLQIVSQKQQVRIARKQLELSHQQVDRMKKLVKAGRKAEGELLEIKAQEAQDEYNLQQARNQLSVAYSELKILLKLKRGESIKIQEPEFRITDQALLDTQKVADIYEAAVQHYPSIKQARLQRQIAGKNVSIAQGTYSPTLSVFGSIGTNYSSFRQEVVDQTVTGVDTIGFVSTDNTPVHRPSYELEYQKVPFGEQLNKNLNEQVGISLQIPIFQGWQNRTQVEVSQLEHLKAHYALEEAKDQLRQDIQRAYTRAKAAQKNYTAAQKNVQSARKSFQYADSRLKSGAATSFDYRNAKERLAQAQSELAQAKYEYLFRIKILQFYQGQPLQFN